jgi:hypothetical protein
MNNALSNSSLHTPAPELAIEQKTLSNFEALEKLIREYTGSAPRGDLINDYVDRGIELAADAGVKGFTRLQESWLRRIYTTLRDTGLNSSRSEAWRSICLESLYQPFFALMHIYRERPHGRYCLRSMNREMQIISHYII